MEDDVLWTIAVILIIIWLLGLMAGYTTGLFIHGLSAIAVILLMVSLIRKVNIYRELRHILRSRNYRRTSSKNISL